MLRREPSARMLGGATLCAALIVAAMVASPIGLHAQDRTQDHAQDKGKDVDQKLETVERALEQDKVRAAELARRSADIAKDRDQMRQQLIATARSAQEQEQKITDLEATLGALNALAREKALALSARRAQLADTLAALERMALYPPEAMVALPETPVDTVRSALLLRAAVPEVEARAVKLRADLDSMRALRIQIATERLSLNTANDQLTGDRQRLASLLDRKEQSFRDTEAERQSTQDRVTRLTAQAKDLHDLMDRVLAERAQREIQNEALARLKPVPSPLSRAPARPSGAGAEKLAALPPSSSVAPALAAPPPAIRPISQAEGRLTLPARGEVIKEFGAAEPSGTASKGLTLRTRPDAQVVAPYDGQVVFAGPFRGYGQILIIEHSEGYHTLLSGLSRIDAVPGQWVLAGEPVGVMGSRTGGVPELYVELRRNGRPINPLPWLALHNGKVSG